MIRQKKDEIMMYLSKFFIGIIFWLILALRFIVPIGFSLFFIGISIFMIIDNFSFSLEGILLTLWFLFILSSSSWMLRDTLYEIKNIFIELKKENFLSKYNFSPKLYLMLEKKFPNLEKNDVEKIISILREYFGFLLKREKYQKTTIPSFAVGFAYKSFMELEEHKAFLKKLFDKNIPPIPLFLFNNHNHESKLLAIEHQDKSTIELWCYFAKKERLDPYCPNKLPSIFQIDDKLKIPSGFSYTFNKYRLIPIIPLKYAPSPYMLKEEIIEMINTKPSSLLMINKKIQYLLGEYDYCKKYKRKDIESLFAVIDDNELLSRGVYGKYRNSNLKEYALKNAKGEQECTTCSSLGVSL